MEIEDKAEELGQKKQKQESRFCMPLWNTFLFQVGGILFSLQI